MSSINQNCELSRSVHFLNREIGDDTLLVENRELPYKGRFKTFNIEYKVYLDNLLAGAVYLFRIIGKAYLYQGKIIISSPHF